MKYKTLMSGWARTMLLAFVALLFGSGGVFASGTLQGLNQGDTNWTSVNLTGWKELDFVPFRVAFTSGSGGNQTINLDFTHLSGSTPGFEDMYFFTNFTSNVSFVSGPTL